MKIRRPRRKISVSLVAAAVLAAFAAGASAQSYSDWSGKINLLGGVKMLENDWKPAEDQTELGVQLDFMPPQWPLNIAVDALVGDSDSESVNLPGGGAVTSDAKTHELDLGLRKYWAYTDRWSPFLGAGLALLRGEVNVSGPSASNSDSDTGVGFWVNGGLLYAFTNHFNIGVQARYSRGDVDVNHQSLDAGGFHLNAMFGFSWGED